MTDLAMLRRAGLRVEDSTHDAATGTITLPRTGDAGHHRMVADAP
jgi:hypothetical protein